MQASARRTVIIASAVVAVLAIAAGIYGIGRWSGNAGLANACPDTGARVAALKGANVGEVAAFGLEDQPVPIGDIAFADGEGRERTLAEWKGRTVLLNLWATWCVPCREEMPALKQLQQALGGPQFEVVAVSIDIGDDAKPRKFYADNDLAGLAFHHDGSLAVFNALKKKGLAFGLPTSLLVDGDGCVMGKVAGPAEWASPDAKNLIGKAIASLKQAYRVGTGTSLR